MVNYQYLTDTAVSIVYDGPPYTRGYTNIVSDRQRLEADLAGVAGGDTLLQEIYGYWGEVQPDPAIDTSDPDMQPTIEDRVADVEEALAGLMYGGDTI